MNKTWTDAELVDSIKSGDQEGIKQVYKSYATMIYQFVINNNGSQEDAEDVFHEALVTMISRIRTAGFNLTCKLSSFLYSISRNIWLYRLRQKGNFKITDTENKDIILPDSEIPELEIFEEKHELISKLFNKISPDCQQLLHAFYFKEKPMKDIAVEMGLTDGFVRIKKMRCIESLKNLVFNHPDYKKITNL